MKITGCLSDVVDFKAEGNLEGSFVISNESGYKLLPSVPENGFTLLCYITSISDVLFGKGGIVFRGRATGRNLSYMFL